MSLLPAIPILFVLFIVMVALAFVSSAILGSIIRGAAPWVPLDRQSIVAVRDLLRDLPDGATVVDLGAGDGRVLRAIAVAHPSTRCVGVEQSRILVMAARVANILRGTHVRYVRGDFFRYPLADVDVIVCYLWPKVMDRLSEKFTRECRPGTRVIAAWFPIAGWRPVRVVTTAKNHRVHEYRTSSSQ